jgi:hypothetical protein
LHPPFRLNLTSGQLKVPKDTSGRTTFETPALPSLTARGVEVRTKLAMRRGKRRKAKIRSSPVYAGHAIKPLEKRSFRNKRFYSGACSLGQDQGYPAHRKTPAHITFQGDGSLPFRAIQADVLKGMVSCRIGF